MARFDGDAQRPAHDRTHVQDGPRPERSDHSNLGPQERTPHPTVPGSRHRAARRRAPWSRSSGHAGSR